MVARKVAAGRRKAPVKREYWTLDKKAEFLRELSLTANVTASARAVGMSEKGVYRLRMQSEAFREAWATALREGYVRLELLMLERAMNGTVRPVWHGGSQVGETTEFSERLAMQLLNQHRDSVMRAAPPREIESDQEVRDRLAAKLAAMSERIAADEAE